MDIPTYPIPNNIILTIVHGWPPKSRYVEIIIKYFNIIFIKNVTTCIART